MILTIHEKSGTWKAIQTRGYFFIKDPKGSGHPPLKTAKEVMNYIKGEERK
jgi:hypothetical protein